MTRFEGSASATFENPAPASAVVTGVGTNQITWGTPFYTTTPASSMTFNALPTFQIEESQIFSVGNLAYYNGVTLENTEMASCDFDVHVGLTKPTGIGSKDFLLPFDIVTTPNTGDPSADSDYVFLPSGFASQVFTTPDGRRFTLELVGFGTITGGGYSTVSQFFVQENQTASADVLARFVPSPHDLRLDTYVRADGFSTLTVTYTIADTASPPFEIGFYQSVDAAFGAGDIQLSTRTISAPADLTVGTHTKRFPIGSGAGQVRLPGMGAPESNDDYHILAVLDPTNAIPETDVDPFNEDNCAPVLGAYRDDRGPIFVHGTSGNDTYTLTDEGTLLILSVGSPLGSVNVPYDRSQVTQVRIRTHDGNDIVDAALTSISLQTWGGQGDDRLDGGQANDVIYGGAGDDLLEGNIGTNLLDGGGGDDTIQNVYLSDTVIGGDGSDMLTGWSGDNTFVITGPDSGTINSGTFTGVERLTGNTGQDSFRFGPGGVLTGILRGGPGVDTLSYASFGAPVVVNLGAKTATSLRLYSSVENLIGSGGADTLIGSNSNSTWQVTGADAGRVGQSSFTGFENLVGGAKNDVFKLSDGAGISGAVDGGAGVNTLDYSPCTTPVNVNLAAASASAIGRVAGIRNVIGGQKNDTLTGDGGANVLVGSDGDDTLNGRNGNDILIGGKGVDIILGGPGDDLLIAGSTALDRNATALAALSAEWSRPDLGYADRAAHLRGTVGGGLNGSFKLTSSVVKDDRVVDSLTGGAGRDWLWALPAEAVDKAIDELLN